MKYVKKKNSSPMKIFSIITITCFFSIWVFSQNSTKAEKSMEIAQAKCDIFLSSFFGKSIFSKHLLWDKKLSFINCESEEKDVEYHNYSSMDINCIPHLYDFTYHIKTGCDTIFHFRIGCDSLMSFNFPETDYWQSKFYGYKFLLEGKFSVSYQKAKGIGLKNGFVKKNMRIELQHQLNCDINDYSSYYWEVEPLDFEKSTKILQIYAQNEFVAEAEKFKVLVE